MSDFSGAMRVPVDTEIDRVLAEPCVHQLTKDILRTAREKDCVDAYYDVQLAAELLKARMNELLGIGGEA
jgi:hypothetical protein